MSKITTLKKLREIMKCKLQQLEKLEKQFQLLKVIISEVEDITRGCENEEIELPSTMYEELIK